MLRKTFHKQGNLKTCTVKSILTARERLPKSYICHCLLYFLIWNWSQRQSFLTLHSNDLARCFKKHSGKCLMLLSVYNVHDVLDRNQNYWLTLPTEYLVQDFDLIQKEEKSCPSIVAKISAFCVWLPLISFLPETKSM